METQDLPNPALELTESAAAHVSKMLAQRKKGLGLRIALRSGGCSGFAYAMEYADAQMDGDVVSVSRGCKVFMDKKTALMMSGSVIDYVKEGLNEGLKIVNPNESGSCGCGKSVSF